MCKIHREQYLQEINHVRKRTIEQIFFYFFFSVISITSMSLGLLTENRFTRFCTNSSGPSSPVPFFLFSLTLHFYNNKISPEPDEYSLTLLKCLTLKYGNAVRTNFTLRSTTTSFKPSFTLKAFDLVRSGFNFFESISVHAWPGNNTRANIEYNMVCSTWALKWETPTNNLDSKQVPHVSTTYLLQYCTRDFLRERLNYTREFSHWYEIRTREIRARAQNKVLDL